MSGFTRSAAPSLDEMMEKCEATYDLSDDDDDDEYEEPRVVELDENGEVIRDVASDTPADSLSASKEVRPADDFLAAFDAETAGTGTEEEKWKSLVGAKAAKEEGNEHFRAKEYEEAVESYTRAVSLCPEDGENAEFLAICLGNRAACYTSLDANDLVISDCTLALTHNPRYVKVIVRRYQAFEKEDRPDEALKDAQAVQQLDPSFPRIDAEIARLTVAADVKMNKMKDEALGKLKELGNSILGNFGMSLDSFNMKQDPTTGGWSMSMGQGGGEPGNGK
jgi:tetratricopeptide (TPR) repeat protein